VDKVFMVFSFHVKRVQNPHLKSIRNARRSAQRKTESMPRIASELVGRRAEFLPTAPVNDAEGALAKFARNDEMVCLAAQSAS
jgi:hypothetical protein